MNVQCTRHARKAPRQGEGESEGRAGLAPKLVPLVEARRLQQRDNKTRARHSGKGCSDGGGGVKGSDREATVGDKRLRIDNGQMRETARTVMGTALMRRH